MDRIDSTAAVIAAKMRMSFQLIEASASVSTTRPHITEIAKLKMMREM